MTYTQGGLRRAVGPPVSQRDHDQSSATGSRRHLARRAECTPGRPNPLLSGTPLLGVARPGCAKPGRDRAGGGCRSRLWSACRRLPRYGGTRIRSYRGPRGTGARPPHRTGKGPYGPRSCNLGSCGVVALSPPCDLIERRFARRARRHRGAADAVVPTVEAELRLWSLLTAQPALDRITLHRPIIELSVDAEGRRSWDSANLRPRRSRGIVPPPIARNRLRATSGGTAPNTEPRHTAALSKLGAGASGVIDGTVRYRDHGSGSNVRNRSAQRHPGGGQPRCTSEDRR